MRKLVIILIVFGGFGLLLWSQRVTISDALYEAERKASTPEAVSFAEVKETATEAPQEDLEPEEEEIAPVSEDPTEEPDAEEMVPPEEPIEPPPAEEPSEESADLPAEFNLAVPFTSQAPAGDWSLPYQEACEEASIYMVHEYYSGRAAGTIPATEADEAINDIVDFENALFGFYKDTTATQTAVLAEQMWGYERVETIENPTEAQIKAHITAGRPVIIPAAGQQLGNPYFTAPGPLYHMLVIKGFTEDEFITNDPGTRRGADFAYDIDHLLGTIHDWNDGDVLNGKKVALVIYPL